MNFLKGKTRFRVQLGVIVTVVTCIVSRLIIFYIDGGALYRAFALLELSCVYTDIRSEVPWRRA